jgi:hypothetical protein
VECYCATNPEEAFQAQQILARSKAAPAFRDATFAGAIMLGQFFSWRQRMKILSAILFAALTVPVAVAQQNAPDSTPDSAKPPASKKDKGKKEPVPGSDRQG